MAGQYKIEVGNVVPFEDGFGHVTYVHTSRASGELHSVTLLVRTEDNPWGQDRFITDRDILSALRPINRHESQLYRMHLGRMEAIAEARRIATFGKFKVGQVIAYDRGLARITDVTEEIATGRTIVWTEAYQSPSGTGYQGYSKGGGRFGITFMTPKEIDGLRPATDAEWVQFLEMEEAYLTAKSEAESKEREERERTAVTRTEGPLTMKVYRGNNAVLGFTRIKDHRGWDSLSARIVHNNADDPAYFYEFVVTANQSWQLDVIEAFCKLIDCGEDEEHDYDDE